MKLINYLINLLELVLHHQITITVDDLSKTIIFQEHYELLCSFCLRSTPLISYSFDVTFNVTNLA